MFDFYLDEFADPCSGCSKIADNEVPFRIGFLLQLILKKEVILITDDIFKIRFLLHLDRFQTKPGVFGERQILVQSLNSQVYGFGLEIFHQEGFVGKQIPLCQFLLLEEEIRDGISVCRDCIL